jgi:transposase
MVWHPRQAYGQDSRNRVLNARGSNREVALRCGENESYVARACSRHRRLGEDRLMMQCNHVPAKLSGLEQVLAAQVAAVNDQTLKQLGQ